MYHIIYSSHATQPFSDYELVHLLHRARQRNQAEGVTGVLLCGSVQFLQVIEGEREAVESLYARVLRDPRHTQLLKLADKPITSRSFGDWSMAFEARRADELPELAAVRVIEALDFGASDLSNADKALLHMYRHQLLFGR